MILYLDPRKLERERLAKEKEALKLRNTPKPEFICMENIAKSIVNKRRSLHLTQKQLASLIKSDQSVISKIECRISLPSLALLERIAKAFGTTIKIDLN